MAADDATTIEDLHSDLIARALSHMDGPTLASASCSASAFRSLASDHALWRRLCLSTWPSLAHPRLLSLLSGSPGAHRRFFSHSFPFPDPDGDCKDDVLSDDLPTELVSAVDLYHKGIPVFSRVVETDTSSSRFLSSPFRIDALDREPPEAPPATSPEDLTLSWAAIDPETRRAVNLSGRRPLSVDRHWISGETLVRFAVVVRGCAASVVVTCGKETGHVRGVSLTVEDAEGRAMDGRGSLGILKGAMEGGRRGVKWETEVRGRYEEYLRGRKARREARAMRAGIVDFLCTAFGSSIFLSLLMLLAFK